MKQLHCKIILILDIYETWYHGSVLIKHYNFHLFTLMIKVNDYLKNNRSNESKY